MSGYGPGTPYVFALSIAGDVPRRHFFSATRGDFGASKR